MLATVRAREFWIIDQGRIYSQQGAVQNNVGALPLGRQTLLMWGPSTGTADSINVGALPLGRQTLLMWGPFHWDGRFY